MSCLDCENCRVTLRITHLEKFKFRSVVCSEGHWVDGQGQLKPLVKIPHRTNPKYIRMAGRCPDFEPARIEKLMAELRKIIARRDAA